MNRRIGQISYFCLLLLTLLPMMSQAVIEKCRDLYGQYPYFFMLPVYLGKVDV
jgi:hypothetical protein